MKYTIFANLRTVLLSKALGSLLIMFTRTTKITAPYSTIDPIIRTIWDVIRIIRGFLTSNELGGDTQRAGEKD